MKKLIVAGTALALLLATTPAFAGGYSYKRHGSYGYGHHGYKYGYKHGYRHGYKRHRHHRHHGHGYYALGALAGGLLLGYLLTRPYNPPSPSYSAPPPRAQINCKPTTGTGYVNGRLAQFSGTWCYDNGGTGYVVQGSERFVGYLQ